MDFETLYTGYSADVFRFAFWLSGENDKAKDITSETFVRAWARRATIRTCTLKAYLFTIARNIHLENVRKGRHHDDLQDTHIDSSPGPDVITESKMELQRVLRVIGTLPETDRTAFVMRVGHELSYEEIAKEPASAGTLVEIPVTITKEDQMEAYKEAKHAIFNRIITIGAVIAFVTMGISVLAMLLAFYRLSS